MALPGVTSTAVRRRRALVAGAAAALGVASGRASAQRAAAPKVAFLSGSSAADFAPFYASFVDGLRERGYRDGDNVALVAGYADYSAAAAQRLAQEIAAQRPAVVVASGGAIAPAFALTPALPVVLMHSGDPVVAGFAESFARPGRHATGVSLLALDLIEKRLEFLKEVQPRMSRVGFLASPEHAGQQRELAASRAAAEKFGVEIVYREARTGSELASALPAVAAARPDAVLLFSDALMVGQRKPLADFFLRHRIPSAAGWVAFTEAGHLLSYGPERHAAWRRLAYFVDRLLQGARPAELPIELPTAIELTVNRGTATAMGLTLPPSLLVRADRVLG